MFCAVVLLQKHASQDCRLCSIMFYVSTICVREFTFCCITDTDTTLNIVFLAFRTYRKPFAPHPFLAVVHPLDEAFKHCRLCSIADTRITSITVSAPRRSWRLVPSTNIYALALCCFISLCFQVRVLRVPEIVREETVQCRVYGWLPCSLTDTRTTSTTVSAPRQSWRLAPSTKTPSRASWSTRASTRCTSAC